MECSLKSMCLHKAGNLPAMRLIQCFRLPESVSTKTNALCRALNKNYLPDFYFLLV
ncbi:MAG: hypothetical protein J6T41_04165 [Neisseriaceae bacterium]|nr:hypothetical protein [Neisseriaceae bacterium]